MNPPRLILVLLSTLLLLTVALHAKPKPPENKPDNEHSVVIKGMKYSPASLPIAVGDTVVWTNSDDHDHTVVADDGSFNSGNIGNGGSFRHTFKKKGKFAYSCTYHPRMKGSVTVSDQP
jgi:plastocyanin